MHERKKGGMEREREGKEGVRKGGERREG
jgi:hypothetical protein